MTPDEIGLMYQYMERVGTSPINRAAAKLLLLIDLRAATVEIVTQKLERSGDSITGGLIDHVIPSPAYPLTGGERNLWRVRLGVALVMLLERDLSLYYLLGVIHPRLGWPACVVLPSRFGVHLRALTGKLGQTLENFAVQHQVSRLT